MSSDEQFIQAAIKHPGSLTRWAEQHDFKNKDGTIDLRRARAYAKRRGLTHRLRQINLAANLRRLNR